MDTDACWTWPIPAPPSRRDQRPTAGHRYVYRLIYKMLVDPDLPDELHLHHTCEHTWCVNPFHLKPRTPSAHASEHLATRNRARTKTTCKNGHDLTNPDNVAWTEIVRRGERVPERYCRACRSMWKKQRRERSSDRGVTDA